MLTNDQNEGNKPKGGCLPWGYFYGNIGCVYTEKAKIRKDRENSERLGRRVRLCFKKEPSVFQLQWQNLSVTNGTVK